MVAVLLGKRLSSSKLLPTFKDFKISVQRPQLFIRVNQFLPVQRKFLLDQHSLWYARDLQRHRYSIARFVDVHWILPRDCDDSWNS